MLTYYCNNMSSKPESLLIRNKIRPYLEELGARVVKYHGDAMNEAGVADLLICYKGDYIAMEVKMKGEEPRPNQRAFLRSIQKAGGRAGVVYSHTWKEDVDKILLTKE